MGISLHSSFPSMYRLYDCPDLSLQRRVAQQASSQVAAGEGAVKRDCPLCRPHSRVSRLLSVSPPRAPMPVIPMVHGL